MKVLPSSNPAPDHPVIAVITNRYATFQKPIIDHIAQLLNDEGYGVLCIAGRALEPEPEHQSGPSTSANAIYSAASGFDVRGFIIFSITIGYHAKPDKVTNMIRQFRHKPLVSFGVEVPGISSIGMNNHESMTRLMEHMTRDPARRRYVFIRGFRNMPDSVVRENVFRQTLARKNIDIDERLIIDGNFMTSDSYHALDQLLQQTRDIDAVIAANDAMAVSAIHALKKHGLRVPDDVIVSGFDDSVVASRSSPPVTTIGYSFKSRANIAVDNIIAQINGHPCAPANNQLRNIDGNLVIRASSLPRNETMESARNKYCKAEADLAAFREHLRASLASQQAPDWLCLDDLLDDISTILSGQQPCHLTRLHAALDDIMQNPQHIQWWRHFHYHLGNSFRILGNMNIPASALSELSDLLMRIHEAIWSVQAKYQLDMFMYQQVQDLLHLQLSAVSDLDELGVVTRGAFEKFRIKRAYILLFDTPGNKPGSNATLHIAYHSNAMQAHAPVSCRLDEVLPMQFRKELTRGMLLLCPLCAGTTHYGYFLVDPSGIENLNFEFFAHSLSNTLRNFTQLKDLHHSYDQLQGLVREQVEINQSLKNEVEHRERTELENRDLQNKMIHLARINSYEQMATGLAHELNQPLTSIVLNVDAALHYLDEFSSSKPELADTLSDISEDAYRAGEIIRSLRRILIKDDSSRTTFGLKALFVQASQVMESDARNNKIEIEINTQGEADVVADRVQIAQVLVNLIRNSIEAISATDTAQRKIALSLRKEEAGIIVAVEDTGPGLAEGIDPFANFETGKPGGMGMGLSISRSIIDSHGGQIWIDSRRKRGACVLFTLPHKASP